MNGKEFTPPVHSLDPVDWRMYCDLLQDADRPAGEWGWARRVADSLDCGPGLTLVLLCPSAFLEQHWLRVGKTWFIPVEGTYLDRKEHFLWWRPEWVREGFDRYPVDRKSYPPREPEKMIAFASGTPWSHPHPEFDRLVQRQMIRLRRRFFATHGLVEQPRAWL